MRYRLQYNSPVAARAHSGNASGVLRFMEPHMQLTGSHRSTSLLVSSTQVHRQYHHATHAMIGEQPLNVLSIALGGVCTTYASCDLVSSMLFGVARLYCCSSRVSHRYFVVVHDVVVADGVYDCTYRLHKRMMLCIVVAVFGCMVFDGRIVTMAFTAVCRIANRFAVRFRGYHILVGC